MRISWRIIILGIALAVSVSSIMAGEASQKFIAFLLVIGLFIILSLFHSKSGKILVTIIFLVVLGFIIFSSVQSGVVVKSIERDSVLFEEGMKNGEIIKEINGKTMENKNDYSELVSVFENGEENRVEIKTDKKDYIFLTNETLGISVDNIPKTGIQAGLDLRGGARALVQPDVEITDAELDDLVDISRNRFNVYGLSDVNIKGVSDLDGNKFMLVDVAGATPSDLEQLISQQGKFEAQIANKTVFEGGERDISDVCRNDASCASVTGCSPSSDGSYFCNFAFAVYLKESAAEKHADATRDLGLDGSGQYLSEDLYLFVDGEQVDSLKISSSLRGQITTQISIQGSGSGATQEEAIKDARASMNHLQTVLLTGSLPYKLEIVKLDTISPTLGGGFVYSILIAALSAIVVVSLIIFAKYRSIKSSLALLFTSFSELIIILGVAALIKWNLDLPSIAGILATIGTGVDQQIIIMDEASGSLSLSVRERIKRASSIILSAYLTLVAAMFPLYWAGAGLFKGFALTTILGVTAGVLITRPAFAEMIRRIN
ncbi:hypothetical protein HY450_02370 [Candidatus Pacearchaeota archaeon]|nr:hypothetical protein [Candidatus Pacearchaeota archaeon]